MSETFMKERPVFPLLISMALPMVISMLVNSLYNIIDSFFVASISEDAMTALSLVYPIQNLINAIAIGFGIGMNAVISNYLGAGDRDRANKAASHGLALTLLHGLVIMIVSVPLMPSFLRLFTSSEQVLDYGIRYSRIVFSCALVTVTGLAFEKLFQAVGRMKVSMVSLMAGCLTNIILDPFLIFGIGPFPAMGISGAAVATVSGQALSVVIYLIVYFIRPTSARLGWKYLGREKGLHLRLYSIGIPAILNLALPSLLISALNAILAQFSQIYVVVLGIYYKLQTFLYLTANGLVQGMRPLIGYNYGAGESGRVRKIYQYTLEINAVIMLVGTVICLLIPGTLIGFYTVNPETVTAGAAAMRIISAGFLVSAVSVTTCGALEGLGKGLPSFVISLFRYAAIPIPAALILVGIWGPQSVWNAFWIAELVTAVVSYCLYRREVRA